jgi:hypothetical protein
MGDAADARVITPHRPRAALRNICNESRDKTPRHADHRVPEGKAQRRAWKEEMTAGWEADEVDEAVADHRPLATTTSDR